MSIFEFVKGSILKCLKGSQSWVVQSQQLETWLIKIKHVVSKTKLDPSEQIIDEGLHNARPAAGSKSQTRTRPWLFLVMHIHIVGENCWFDDVSPSLQSHTVGSE